VRSKFAAIREADVSTVTYVGQGMEIEDDAVRLRRLMLESRREPVGRVHGRKAQRWRRARGPARLIAAAAGRWR
jgi:hypothetical protein